MSSPFTATLDESATTSPAPVPPPRPRYRTELQGLRALAVAMVVLYHVFLDRVSGGVDIFLLISAFLLTSSFMARIQTRQPLAVPRYWIKTFTRLLPPAVATILAVLLLVYLFFPAYRWREVLQQAMASALYYENWHLAAGAVDYYAVDRTQASPFQHFWSLSIQGQVFLVWPLLFLAAAWRIRHTYPRRAPLSAAQVRRSLTWLFGPIFVVSLGWSIYETATSQAFAYFNTFARLWEFALGSLLAIWLPAAEDASRRNTASASPSGRVLRVIAGWVGLLGMVSCGLMVTVAGAFPGAIALWPLLSASLIIIAGNTGSPWGVDRWLSHPVLNRLGDTSYALYLVHWPLLITMMVLQNSERPGIIEGIVIVLLSVRIAFLLTKYVDAPIRTNRALRRFPARGVVVILLCLALALVPVIAIRGALDRQTARALAAASANNPGAAVLTGASTGPADPTAAPIPLPEDIPWDWAGLEMRCKGRLKPTSAVLASACSQSASGEAEKVILIAGDSRTQQYMAALRPLAEQRGFTLVSILKGGCPLALEGVDEMCHEWNVQLIRHVETLRPAAVFTTTTRILHGIEEVPVPGVDTLVNRLTTAGIGVIGLRDQPRMPFNPIDCVSERSEEQCTVTTRGIFAEEDPNQALTRNVRGSGVFVPVDLLPWICPDDQCRPVIGNVFVYLDEDHLTQMYATTLAPVLDAQLTTAGWRW